MSKKLYRLDGILTVVDAAHLLSHLDEQKSEGVENESVEQLAFADRILLNKCNLLLTGQLKTGRGGEEPDFLQSDGTDHVHDESVSLVSWNSPGLELNVDKLQTWISSLMQELGTELLRNKGVLAVKGCRDKFIFQGVHMLFSGDFASDVTCGSDVSSGVWKDVEERECRFVLLARS